VKAKAVKQQLQEAAELERELADEPAKHKKKSKSAKQSKRPRAKGHRADSAV
jgi:hypothetical protein